MNDYNICILTRKYINLHRKNHNKNKVFSVKHTKKDMSSILVTIIAAIAVVGFFALAMSLTYIFKGHHIQSEISTNPNMQKMGIKCAVQETREDMGLNDCDEDNLCSGNCAGCDIDHTESKKTSTPNTVQRDE